jgi:hypothetical protein
MPPPRDPAWVGSVEVVVGPFSRFSQLRAFTQALHGLPGIKSVATRQFYRGMAHFWVRYDSPIPLATRLGELSQFKPKVASSGSGQIDVQLDAESAHGDSQVGETARRSEANVLENSADR